MKRFDHLEFDNTARDPSASQPHDEADHDEYYWLKRADAERREGLHENALRFYSRALEVNKSLVQGWVGQVQMLIALREYYEAELWARKALELFRNHGDLTAGRAQALCRQGDFVQAMPLSDTALKQEGQSAYRWMVRGELMIVREQEVDQHCFDKAMQINTDWLTAIEIGDICVVHRKYTKALPRYRQAVAAAADQPLCWLRQGNCEMELGLVGNAKRSLSHCLELKPGHLEARAKLDGLKDERFSLSRRIKRLFRRD